ncbi:MAG: hypothetical protein LBR25_08035 [Erysipelotrichaceae bacterium]|jgi:hypothetical protein|nr:hypothetical protein [Erysipelotrichaceae bacterium]
MTKNGKVYSLLASGLCMVAVMICIIVDYAIHQQLTWSRIVTISVLFGWCVTTPLFLKKNQILFTLLAITALVQPFLWLLGSFTSNPSWYFPMGAIIGCIGIVLLWVSYFIFCFIRIGVLYQWALVVFLSTMVASPLIRHIVRMYTDARFDWFNEIINLLGGAALCGFLVYMGHQRENKKAGK